LRGAGSGPDIGVEFARRWIGAGYFTFGLKGCDVTGNLLDLPVRDNSLDGVVLTEVLEHCTHPFRAVDEVYRALKPGGALLVTSPFFWRKFETIKIRPCEWTKEGAFAYDLMRRFECMGMRAFTRATTGYLVEGTK
jgi:ubiquinone/menaquinone biosynthesis C-methylase UbiE